MLIIFDLRSICSEFYRNKKMRSKIFSLLMLIVVYADAQRPQQNDSLFRKLNDIVKRSFEERFSGLEKSNDCLFEGNIEIINKNTIKYDDEIMFVNTDEKYLKIFEKGIFFPGLITGPVKTGKECEEELKSMFQRNDSITISNFVEKEKFYNTPAKREFSFLVFYKKLLNPTEYNITLTNKNIKTETDLETFINGAVATEIRYISIWI